MNRQTDELCMRDIYVRLAQAHLKFSYMQGYQFYMTLYMEVINILFTYPKICTNYILEM